MFKDVLIVDSVLKSYDLKIILSDVYLRCETGQIIGLLGRNGSGKSTLLKIIFGIESADNKFVKLNEKVLISEKDRLKNISYLNQDSFVPNFFFVNKAIKLSINKNRSEEFYNDEIIIGIRNKTIKHLSTGELRYLEIKIILFNESKFCLLDEPFSGLSPILVEKICNLIKKYSTSKGIIITDHNYTQVLKICSKIILLKNGKTIPITDHNLLIDYGYLSNL